MNKPEIYVNSKDKSTGKNCKVCGKPVDYPCWSSGDGEKVRHTDCLTESEKRWNKLLINAILTRQY